MVKIINPDSLIPMDLFLEEEPIRIDLVYKDAGHPRNMFGQAIYRKEARLWAHKDLANVILLAARYLHKEFNFILELKDCLRTVEAQEKMIGTDIIKANPDWLEEPDRMLSPPGRGAHPRGMAIDVALLDKNGEYVDMGSEFDQIDETSHRAYDQLSPEALENREHLETAFMEAARRLNLVIFPYTNEWWDFRFLKSLYNLYAPLKDIDLPPQMRMTESEGYDIPDFDDDHFKSLKEKTLATL